MHDSRTEALLFDLGGVVFGIDFDKVFRHWAQLAGMPAETIRSRFRADEWYERHERGEISAARYFDSLRDSLGISLTDEQFGDGWNAIFEPEPVGVSALIASLAGRIPVYAFSNSNVLHQRCWERRYAQTLGLFREVYVSCELGLRKPEAAAFHEVSGRIGVSPARVLFFDDTLENVTGARLAGMSAVQVRGIDDIRAGAAACLEGGGAGSV